MRTVAFLALASLWCLLPLLWRDWYLGRIGDWSGLLLFTTIAISLTAGFRRIRWGELRC
jgi:hypothetical protein